MQRTPAPMPQNDTIWWYRATRPNGHDLLRIVRQGRRLTFEFNGHWIGEDSECLAGIRDELYDLLASVDFECVTFDLTDVNVVPSGLLGLLSSASERGCEVELLNPSQELQEILRDANLDSRVLMRGATT